ncbi:methyltransferase RsmF C-terminal domain-like protein [Thermophagus xiamenensis]|uniref:16S rRNA C967 or C1407 C5-methylase, RsmB/RsmF family n=1 Tax=Thermophagus xiamenensis TaxID=385682 RepID=A0A1I2EY43_9BACT|nr:RNA methyltransferase [Thermophagus xiamenensis]SFE97150.1 16S rRNA C967 or C1407 C5-methylase, RsmB/RsmF family [Thermophagus xiamenensis]
MNNKTPLPEAFLARIRKTFPLPEQEQLVQSLELPPISSVRINPRKTNINFPASQPVPWCKHGFYLKERPLYTINPLFHAGAFYPQEASSMFLWHILEQLLPKADREDIKILDLCGAPGGKASLIASLLDGQGLLVANEVIRSRAEILKENMLKWGAPNVVVTRSDPAKFTELSGLFDIMVVDAPCSGEGMFRKGDWARSQWSQDNTALCAVRQRRILQDAWPALKENGLLIYSTCTFNPEENEENLKWLVKKQMAEVLTLTTPSEWNITEIPVETGNGLAFYPHKVKGEGFFIAVVRKNEFQKPLSVRKPKKKSVITPTSDVAALLKYPQQFSFFENLNQWSAFPQKYESLLFLLQKQLDIINFGIVLGNQQRKKFTPALTLPFSWEFNNRFPTIDLDKEEALHYLKGETLLPKQGLPNGVVLLTYQNIPIGFVKNVGTRCNNLFPKNWRIRMEIDFS